MDQFFSVHQRNIQSLLIELFKIKQSIRDKRFQMKDNLKYNLISQTELLKSSVNTSQYGLNSLRVFSSKVWNIVPTEVKISATLKIFKQKIRKREANDSNCKLCLPYIQNIGHRNVI